MPATPDTSNANVARVLRNCADSLKLALGETPNVARVRALADALEQTGSKTAFYSALTQDEWAELVERAVNGWNIRCAQSEYATLPDALDAALRKAFPEIAPHD